MKKPGLPPEASEAAPCAAWLACASRREVLIVDCCVTETLGKIEEVRFAENGAKSGADADPESGVSVVEKTLQLCGEVQKSCWCVRSDEKLALRVCESSVTPAWTGAARSR